MNRQYVKKKIESILNRYYKETGIIVCEITTIRELNKKFNYNLKIEFKENNDDFSEASEK